MTKFWHIWINVWCLAVGLFGLVLAICGLEATSGLTRLIFSFLNNPEKLTLDAHLRFSLAVLGAVTIGWSITLYAAVRAANQLEEQASQSVWRLITLSVISWYTIDSVLSVATGFWLNTIPNTVFIAAFLYPIIGGKIITNR